MATRIAQHTGNCLIKSFTDPSMPTFTVGDRVKFGSSDDLLAAVTGPDPLSFGYVYQQNGTTVDVILDGTAIIKATVVASGTATRGKWAVMSATANKYEDAATTGGGTTVQYLAGKFLNSGSDGDVVGLLIGGVNFSTVKA